MTGGLAIVRILSQHTVVTTYVALFLLLFRLPLHAFYSTVVRVP